MSAAVNSSPSLNVPLHLPKGSLEILNSCVASPKEVLGIRGRLAKPPSRNDTRRNADGTSLLEAAKVALLPALYDWLRRGNPPLFSMYRIEYSKCSNGAVQSKEADYPEFKPSFPEPVHLEAAALLSFKCHSNSRTRYSRNDGCLSTPGALVHGYMGRFLEAIIGLNNSRIFLGPHTKFCPSCSTGSADRIRLGLAEHSGNASGELSPCCV